MSKLNLITIFVIVGCFLLPGNHSEAVTIIKFATLAPEGSTWLKIMHEYDEAVQKATQGQVKFKLYPGGVAGDEKDVMRKIRFNQYHSGGFTGVGLGEILPAVRVLDAPLLFKDYAEVDHIYSLFTPEFENQFKQKGFTLLGWTQVGFIYILSQKEIRTMADLPGVKMWTWEGDPISAATFKALGISPIPLPVTDVLTSLQTNLIDTVYTGPLACVSLQWFTKVKYISSIKLTYATGAVLVSDQIFKKISAAHQKVVKDLAQKYFRQLVLQSRKDDETSMNLMLQNGLKMITFDPNEEIRFNTAGKKARDSLSGKLYSADLLHKIEAELKKFRTQTKDN
ncbi:TRAP transporter substrate-binding protein DctP [candidate division CSSED10-310 bacterium]|uniref:TRAP transporter substrate-binding protein DctP n=1 Tax=candidate division CSSED10-310 bacterium TaxID=2855610 RepID=A0ABV6YTE3_UNCC1